MADEWVCDECGYSTSLEPEAGICPACKAKMTKIDGSDDIDTQDDEYDENDLAVDIDDDFDWDEEKEEDEDKK